MKEYPGSRRKFGTRSAGSCRFAVMRNKSTRARVLVWIKQTQTRSTYRENKIRNCWVESESTFCCWLEECWQIRRLIIQNMQWKSVGFRAYRQNKTRSLHSLIRHLELAKTMLLVPRDRARVCVCVGLGLAGCSRTLSEWMIWMRGHKLSINGQTVAAVAVGWLQSSSSSSSSNMQRMLGGEPPDRLTLAAAVGWLDGYSGRKVCAGMCKEAMRNEHTALDRHGTQTLSCTHTHARSSLAQHTFFLVGRRAGATWLCPGIRAQRGLITLHWLQ